MSVGLLKDVAELEYPMPNEVNIGRHCYALSEREDEAFDLVENRVRNLFSENGLEEERDYKIEEDAFGNLYVTLLGTVGDKTIACGSHLDSVANGGMYDGVAGVNCAYNFLEKLVLSGQKPDQNFMFVIFRAEESSPSLTGMACTGSQVATGTITKEKLEALNYTYPDGKIGSFKMHFIKRYGGERWEKVLEQLKDPVLRPGKVDLFLETHIEQSRVAEVNDADVGIVIKGIGGAIREIVDLKDSVEWEDLEVVNAGDFEVIKITFKGEKAHTGGTPPNPTDNRDTAEVWYRRDALVAASVCMVVLEQFPYKNAVRFLKTEPDKFTGYTTVPAEQFLEIVVPAYLSKQLCSYLGNNFEVVQRTGAFMAYEPKSLEEGKFEVAKFDSLNALKIPVEVERLVREVVNQEGGVGTVRATVTDFELSSERAMCKLDMRNVDDVAIESLREKIHRMVVDCVPGAEITVVSEKDYVPLSEEVSEELQTIARDLGYKVVLLPSLPGHDIGSLAKVGIPAGFVFIRHDGISHNPKENMPLEYYEKAERIVHTLLRKHLFTDTV